MTTTLRLLLAAIFILASCDLIRAQEQPPTAPPVYVEIIVKACPADPNDIEQCAAAAVANTGLPYRMCPKAINQGKEYNNERSLTRAERDAYYSSIGCIDIPIPPEVMMNGDGQTPSELTMGQCIGHRGYLTAMQYLEKSATITQKAVGGWVCVEHPFMPEGVATF